MRNLDVAGILTPTIKINGEEIRGLVNKDEFFLYRNGVRVRGAAFPDLFIQYLEHLKTHDQAS